MSSASADAYFRPVTTRRPVVGMQPVAGGMARFAEVEVRRRDGTVEILPADAVPALWPEGGIVLDRIRAPRMPIAGVDFSGPRIMGIVNVTPDSFSDGGMLSGPEAAVAHGLRLAAAGAEILDIGGESTRPGAEPVSIGAEMDRVLPVIEGLVAAGCTVPISVDTRNADVAAAALAAGARLINDVSAMTHDPAMSGVAARAEGVCLMHALGDPRTMQDNPVYDDVLLDIFDYLEGRIAVAEAAGIARSRIIIDPGIGFGKTVAHNLTLLRGIGLLHGLGCAILLGVSRKGFIGRLSGETVAARRVPGSIVAGLAGLDAGVQILRVHDVAETTQAISIWRALNEETA